MPKVSIIIPTYNRANFLPRTIKSVLNQTFQDFELIIVDDCSTDNTQEVVKEFQKKDDRIRYIRLDKNSGAPAHPRNVGIQNARGNFISFLDSDDECFPEKLEKQLELFEKGPADLGFVGCNALMVEEKNGKILKEIKLPSFLKRNTFEKLLEHCFMNISVLIKSRVLDNVGLFDENLKFAEDWDMWIRISYKYNFDFVLKPLLKRYIHGGNVTQTLSVDEKIKDLKYILKKYKNLYRKYPEAHSIRLRNMGTIYLLGGDMKMARKYFIKAIKVSPWYLRSYLNFIVSLLGKSVYKRLLKFKLFGI